MGAIQVLRNADGGGVNFSEEKRYEGVRFNVISVTRGWVGVQIPGKKRYVTLEWPHGELFLRDGKNAAFVQVYHLSSLKWSLENVMLCVHTYRKRLLIG